MERILVVDDDRDIVRLVRSYLEKAGYQVITAYDGESAIHMLRREQPHLLILDLMLPDRDGWDVARLVRSDSQLATTPIIMLTARGDEKDVLRGLTLGADDYVSKPCSFDELKARIHALLRRSKTPANPAWRTAYDDGRLMVDLSTGIVSLNGSPVHLTPTESRLLMCLMSQTGQVISHKELLTRVWGPEYNDEVGYLSVYVHYLREKIEADPANPQYVRTRWGMGYYFAAD